MGKHRNMEGEIPATNMPDGDWWRVLWPDPEGVLRRLGVDHGKTVLDLCCGDGYFTVPIAQIVGGIGRVMALDANQELMVQGAQRAADVGVPATAIRWLNGDLCDFSDRLPAEPDYVLIANAFHGVPDKLQLARDVFRVLKPGGWFAIVNWHCRARDETTVLGLPRGPETKLRMRPEAVMDVVLPAGFSLHGVIELPPYHYGMVFEKAKAS